MGKVERSSGARAKPRRVVKRKTASRIAHKVAGVRSEVLSAEDASRLNVLRFMAAHGQVKTQQYGQFVKRLKGSLAKTLAKKIAPSR